MILHVKFIQTLCKAKNMCSVQLHQSCKHKPKHPPINKNKTKQNENKTDKNNIARILNPWRYNKKQNIKELRLQKYITVFSHSSIEMSFDIFGSHTF